MGELPRGLLATEDHLGRDPVGVRDEIQRHGLLGAVATVPFEDPIEGLVVTTGGTGFAGRDLTPEGTRAVLDRDAPGLAEAMRLVSPRGRLSRGVAGTLGRCIVLNTPGSPAGAVECVDAVLDTLPHALDLLAGRPTEH